MPLIDQFIGNSKIPGEDFSEKGLAAFKIGSQFAQKQQELDINRQDLELKRQMNESLKDEKEMDLLVKGLSAKDPTIKKIFTKQWASLREQRGRLVDPSVIEYANRSPEVGKAILDFTNRPEFIKLPRAQQVSAFHDFITPMIDGDVGKASEVTAKYFATAFPKESNQSSIDSRFEQAQGRIVRKDAETKWAKFANDVNDETGAYSQVAKALDSGNRIAYQQARIRLAQAITGQPGRALSDADAKSVIVNSLGNDIAEKLFYTTGTNEKLPASYIKEIKPALRLALESRKSALEAELNRKNESFQANVDEQTYAAPIVKKNYELAKNRLDSLSGLFSDEPSFSPKQKKYIESMQASDKAIFDSWSSDMKKKYLKKQGIE